MRSEQAPAIRLQDYKKPAYSIKSVNLDFKLEPENTLVTNTMVLVRGDDTPLGAPLELDGDEINLVSLHIDGEEIAAAHYELTDDKLILSAVPQIQEQAKEFSLTVVTRINPQANTKLMGLYRSSGNYCTQCEAEGFRRITYFLDRPDVLAVYTTRIEADEKDCPVLLGNGNPQESGKLDNGRHYAIWHDPHPKPSYLFALVAGDLGAIFQDFTTASGRKVTLGIYVENGKEPQAAYAMDALVRSMRWDEEVFGCEYDLDVFNIVAVSDFNMGAMENKGLNVFNDKYVLASTETATDADFENIESIIAHEYFHNWTGNRITCRDWFQLCLKEGLTVFRDQEFSADQRSRAVQRIGDVRKLKSAQFPEDAGPLAHPVRPETYREINNFYTATVYEKGAEVVRMFKTLLGEETFDKGVRLYLSRHDGDAATIEDFIRCFEEASGKDLSQFALWYSQAGTPTVTLSAQYDEAKSEFVLEMEQSIKPTPGQAAKVPMHIPLKIGLIDPKGNSCVAEKITGLEPENGVFNLTSRQAKITFHGIDARPVLSFNQGFSAPINVDFEQTSEDLAHIAAHDHDLFNRAQAWRDHATAQLINGAQSLESKTKPKWDKGLLLAAQKIVCDKALEPAFRALAIALPSEGELAQAIGTNFNPATIHNARKALGLEIGAIIAPHYMEITAELENNGAFTPDAVSAGKRALKNTVMNYCVMANSEVAEAASMEQFKTADNMTDKFAAFMRIVHHHASPDQRDTAIEEFYNDYHTNHIVLDKWFSVQAMEAGENAAQRVKDLMQHEQFSLTNPNRVRSLIGVFAMANMTGFNAASGKGYELVAQLVGQLDRINPQVAARLLTAFRSFRTLETNRQQLALNALEVLGSDGGLSRDTSDILERTLKP